VNLPNTLSAGSPAIFQAALVNPALNLDVRLGFQLKITFMCVSTVVVLERPLDVHRVSVMSFDEVGVIAVYRPDKGGERGK
jgi:hypothetical protein